jgi:hypothetical protein
LIYHRSEHRFIIKASTGSHIVQPKRHHIVQAIETPVFGVANVWDYTDRALGIHLQSNHNYNYALLLVVKE